MKKVSFRVRNFEEEQFLTYNIDNEATLDEDVLDFLEDEEPKGLVPVIFDEEEEYDTFSYDVTGRICLSELSRQEINAEMVLKVMRGLALTLIDMGEYRVPLSYLVLNRNYIYINSDYEVEFICIPLEEMQEEVDLNMFLRNFVASLRFESSENGDYVARLLTYINNTAIFNLRNMVTLVEDLMDVCGVEIPEDASADIYVDYQEVEEDGIIADKLDTEQAADVEETDWESIIEAAEAAEEDVEEAETTEEEAAVEEVEEAEAAEEETDVEEVEEEAAVEEVEEAETAEEEADVEEVVEAEIAKEEADVEEVVETETAEEEATVEEVEEAETAEEEADVEEVEEAETTEEEVTVTEEVEEAETTEEEVTVTEEVEEAETTEEEVTVTEEVEEAETTEEEVAVTEEVVEAETTEEEATVEEVVEEVAEEIIEETVAAEKTVEEVLAEQEESSVAEADGDDDLEEILAFVEEEIVDKKVSEETTEKPEEAVPVVEAVKEVPKKPRLKTKEVPDTTVVIEDELDEFLAEMERNERKVKREQSGLKIKKEIKVNRASIVKSNQEELKEAEESVETPVEEKVESAQSQAASKKVADIPKVNPYLIRVNTEERVMITKQNFKIGKASMGVDYTIKGNGAVSRVHAVITNKDDIYYIKDNKSTNHTIVNGKTLEEGELEALLDDCNIVLGNEEFIFKLG